jgi:diacylglycerol O-acyltransferase / trehalose O-mycolyltransferase
MTVKTRACLALAVMLSACSAVASPAGSQAPSTSPAASQPADDGARIVSVDRQDARTLNLTIDSPAVGSAADGTQPAELVRVRVLLPASFDAEPAKRWPTLYLLHGGGGTHHDWMERSDIEDLTASADLMVVMPDGGEDGWYSDWWNGGEGGYPMWETFHTVELPQLLERNWRAGDKRAVAGLSMGGYGAMAYAGRHPGMYVAAASYSGVLSTSDAAAELDVPDMLWGDPIAQADIWKAHDPVYLADALRGTVLYVAYGDGTSGPLDNGAVPDADEPEIWIGAGNDVFVEKLAELGIPATIDAYGPGMHRWPYWERDLHNSLPLLLDALGG